MFKLGTLLHLFALTCVLNADEPSVDKTTHRELQFENEYVKVWKTVIMPHQPLKMHRHDYPRIVVGLKSGTLTKIEETGEKSELVFEAGKAYWALPDPLGTLHGDINLGSKQLSPKGESFIVST